MDTAIAETLEADHLERLVRALKAACGLDEVVTNLNRLADFVGHDPFEDVINSDDVPRFGRFKTYKVEELPADLPSNTVFSWDDSHAVLESGGAFYRVSWSDVSVDAGKPQLGFRR
jgi:hypothetical protein